MSKPNDDSWFTYLRGLLLLFLSRLYKRYKLLHPAGKVGTVVFHLLESHRSSLGTNAFRVPVSTGRCLVFYSY